MAINDESMIDSKFLKRFTDGVTPPFCSEISELVPGLTNVPYLVVPVPRIEPDDWDLFWRLWEKFKLGTKIYNNVWDSICIWANPNLSNHQLETEYPIIKQNNIHDWSDHFPKMFQSISEAMPFTTIDKIFIASNAKEVPLHIDAIKKFHPWPNALRIMLWDTNEKPTFYLAKWQDSMYDCPIIDSNKPAPNKLHYQQKVDDSDKIYVNLPDESNTFVYSNGEYLHGADLAKPKIILIVWGTPDKAKWIERLKYIKAHSINN